MGTSPTAVLVYGYDLGGSEEWKINGIGEVGDLPGRPWVLPDLPWLTLDDTGDDGDQFVTQAAARLDEVLGEGHGVELVSHCSVDFPMWILAAHSEVAHQGHPERINFNVLADRQREMQWASRLRRALEALAITPTGQPSPSWWLASNL